MGPSTKAKAVYKETILEQAGADGYDSYRVPGVVATKSGTVIAYYDARRGDGPDAKQSLFYCCSEDDGITWSERVPLVEGRKGERIHNIVMLSGNEETVHAFWNQSYTRCFHKVSFNAGKTWGETIDISGTFESFKKVYPWNVYSIGPGHGIQMKSGRMVVPAWLSCGGDTHQPSVFACIFSDDQGKTWSTGGILFHSEDISNPNEGSIVELEDGSLLATVRHDTLEYRCRAFIHSDDCKQGWSNPYFEKALPDPICHASLARFGENGILFSNCAWDDEKGVAAIRNGEKIKWSDDARQNLTIRFSQDKGKNWKYSKTIARKGGYSDLHTCNSSEMIYCIFERDWKDGECIYPQKIIISAFNKEWLGVV